MGLETVQMLSVDDFAGSPSLSNVKSIGTTLREPQDIRNYLLLINKISNLTFFTEIVSHYLAVAESFTRKFFREVAIFVAAKVKPCLKLQCQSIEG